MFKNPTKVCVIDGLTIITFLPGPPHSATSLLRIYNEAVSSGVASLVIAFDMLENLVAKMDRASVVCNHAKIFDQCLAALDIRRQNPATIQNVDDAEKSVINATVTLTKKRS